MNQLLLQYSYLQVLDFLTTVAFLMTGVKEGNPIVRAILSYSPSAIIGLALVKAAAVILGIYCWRMGRTRILTRINILFALVIAWNLVALIAGTAARS
ncbi:MAG: DUF5658 family protein [Acidobacteriota bacterium]|nr:DUF5658 family protein [Acidobacteriota bacterium]